MLYTEANHFIQVQNEVSHRLLLATHLIHRDKVCILVAILSMRQHEIILPKNSAC